MTPPVFRLLFKYCLRTLAFDIISNVINIHALSLTADYCQQ